MRCRVDVEVLALGEELAGQRIEFGDPLDLVAEELDPDDRLLGRRLELQGVAADAEPGPADGGVVALVLEVDQVAEHGVAPVLPALPQPEDGRAVVDRRAEAVDAGDAGHDDHVAALEQGMRGGVAQPVDLVVAAGVLLDVRVGPGEVRLGLVVVEVADEVLDGVVREELAELGVQLGGQRLVVRQDQRRLAVTCRSLSQSEGLSGAGRAKQRLVTQAPAEAIDELVDRPGLVAGGFEWRSEIEFGHGSSAYHSWPGFEHAFDGLAVPAHAGDVPQV